MKFVFLTLISCLFLLSLPACSLIGVRTTEEPGYKVLVKDGNYEIRSYDPFLIAKTAMNDNSESSNSEDSRTKGFRKLFAYISGKNTANKKISMTAPVLEENISKNAGQKISMTAPVLIGQDSENIGSKTMAFILPKEFNLENAPKPNDSTISIEEKNGGRVAALRFSGTISDQSIKDETKKLIKWVEEKGLKPVSSPVAAGYDPPWTLPRLRRNEIQIDLLP